MHAFIFARGGSKGIPNKNIVDFNGSTLLGHSIAILKDYFPPERIYVSSDSDIILDHAAMHGASPVKRPDILATDKSNELLSWLNMCEQLNFEPHQSFLVAPVTSPFRNLNDIKEGVNLWNTKKYDVIMSKSPSSRSPYLNMITEDSSGALRPLTYKADLHRRQDAPTFWDILTVLYITNYEYILKTSKLLAGKVGWIDIPKMRSIDIDTPFDLNYARILTNIIYK